MIDWQKEVVANIKDYFKNLDIDYKPKKTDPFSCLVDFLNLEAKLIKPRPRLIYKSDKVKSISLSPNAKRALTFIEKKIIDGENIGPHQSKMVLDPSYNDGLLNEWIIQHIHLQDAKKRPSDKFYLRADYLLFALFTDMQAIFVDIRPHKEENVFAKKEFLEIIDRNWPQILKEHIHPDADFFAHNYSESEIDLARKKGVMLGTTIINGKNIINPGVGVTSSGHSIQVVLKAGQILRFLYDTEVEIRDNYDSIKRDIAHLTGKPIEKLSFKITRQETWPHFRFTETETELNIFKDYSKINIIS